MKSIQSARARSEEGVIQVRRIAAEVFGSETGFIIGANGSYARREATLGSDIDLFYLVYSKCLIDNDKRNTFEKMVKDAGFKLPAASGVFEDALQTEDLLKNIGGLDDTNTSLTRRMLLLLEGEWIHNQNEYIKVRDELLARYVTDKTPKEKITLFLLNDIIRYWRTICVDYEYKTSDGSKPKGIRLVKLRFSRMCLAFGGIVAVAETIGLEAKQKRERLAELFSLDVLKRVESTLGDHAKSVFALYDEFLAALDNKDIRDKLSSPEYEDAIEFSELRKKGRKFKDELLASLSSKYSESHPIHKALLL